MTNGGYDKDSAAVAMRNGDADVITFGQKFIANPDLPERFRTGESLNDVESEAFYSFGPRGYIDYRSLQINSTILRRAHGDFYGTQ